MKEENTLPYTKTKYFCAEVALIKRVAKKLQVLNDEAGAISYCNDVKKFIQEALGLTQESKNYTHERSAKLFVGISAFLSINSFDEEQEDFTLLLSGFKGVIKEEIMLQFLHTASEISKLLADSPKREFKDTELYFFTQEKVQIVSKLKSELESLFERKTDKERFSISKLINILNLNAPAHNYSVKYVPKFAQINRVESVDKYIHERFEISQHTQTKEFKEFIMMHKFDTGTVQRLTQEHESALRIQREEYEYIVENWEDLDVRITGYENAEIYPRISFKYRELVKKKDAEVEVTRNKDKHLKNRVPNALWLEMKPFREGMSVKEFTENATLAFGDVYYMPKQ